MQTIDETRLRDTLERIEALFLRAPRPASGQPPPARWSVFAPG